MAGTDAGVKRKNEVGVTLANGDGNKENRSVHKLRHRRYAGATREGEETPKLDQEGRGNTKATREGEETPKLDQVDPGNTEATREGEETPKLDQGKNVATREGEETPKLDQVGRGENEATGEGEDTPKPDHENKGKIEATRYVGPVIIKEEGNPGKEGDTREEKESKTKNQAPEVKEHSQVSQLYHVRYLAGSEEAREHSQVSQLYHLRYTVGKSCEGSMNRGFFNYTGYCNYIHPTSGSQ